MNIRKVFNDINRFLPLKIKKTEWIGEQLIIEGEFWSIVMATCWWRILKDDVLIFGCTDENAIEIKKIEGLKVDRIEFQSKFIRSDFVLFFSNGLILESFSTSSLEPWSITIKEETFFSNPSEIQWQT